MKIKSTNNVRNRRNMRKKQIGSILTGALTHRNEASLENLAGHVSRRLNRTMAQIYPAVNRTLNCGVRDGFITKHGNKYSLSSKRNYETDFQHPDATIRAAMAAELRGTDIPAFDECTQRRQASNCGYNFRGTRCRGIDLIDLEQCNYVTTSRYSNYCDFHERVKLIFRYMIFYFENIGNIVYMYRLHGAHVIRFSNEIIYMRNLVNTLKANIITATDAAVIYVRFLKRFAQFIRNEAGQLPDNELKDLLRGKQIPKRIPPLFKNSTKCFGTDLESGELCLNPNEDPSKHCANHECYHIFTKLFMHGGEQGDGLHRDTVSRVLNRFPHALLLFTPTEYHQVTHLPTCLQLYMSSAMRLANHAILQYRKGHTATAFSTMGVEVKKTNNSTFAGNNCVCKCLGDKACGRLFEIIENVIANQNF